MSQKSIILIFIRLRKKINSPVKENVTRGYKFFRESCIHETEGKFHRYKFDPL